MENIDFQNSYFTFKGMIPSTNDEITTLWGRKVVHNLTNAYGVIGTINFNGRGYDIVNLNLTKKFQFPPTIYLYYVESTNPTILKLPPLAGLQNGDQSGYDQCFALIAKDNVVFYNYINDAVIIYFRIHGV